MILTKSQSSVTHHHANTSSMTPIIAICLLLAFAPKLCASWSFGLKSANTPSDVVSSPMPLLSSCFPRDVPLGLRREAVSSALDSRGLCINLSDMNAGVVHVKGKGFYDFMNNKLSNSFPRHNSDHQGLVQEACLLTPKGRVLDKLTIAYFDTDDGETEAFILTSPDLYHYHQEGLSNYASSQCYLYRKLSPLVFPLDQISLSDCTPTTTSLLLTSTDINVLNSIIYKTLRSFVDASDFLPKPGTAIKLALKFNVERDSSVIIASNSFFPNTKGYLMLIHNDYQNQLRDAFCDQDEEDEFVGALPIRSLEYETLRIELCVPGVGREIMGDDSEAFDGSAPAVKCGPLELGLSHTVDMEKGCYLGKEGISALLRNPRGLPRTIYQVIFNDVAYYPKAGDTLFVLGSNEAIKAGVLTSVVPPDDLPPYYDEDGSLDEGFSTIAIALIRRAEYIIERMDQLGLVSIGDTVDTTEFRIDAPLHSLEVIVAGTNTIGTLRAVPVALKEIQQESSSTIIDVPSTMMDFIPASNRDAREASPKFSSSQDSMSQEEIALQLAMEEAEMAKKAAEAAAVDLKRAQGKIEALKIRAEAAIAARQQGDEGQRREEAKVAEAARKMEKIAVLKARTEAAIEERRKKKAEDQQR